MRFLTTRREKAEKVHKSLQDQLDGVTKKIQENIQTKTKLSKARRGKQTTTQIDRSSYIRRKY